jgi:hypothetical protein
MLTKKCGLNLSSVLLLRYFQFDNYCSISECDLYLLKILQENDD